MSKLGKRLIKTAKYNRTLVKELEEAKRLPPVKVFASAQEVLDYLDEDGRRATEAMEALAKSRK